SVAHDALAPESRGDLSDAVAHRARAEHTNSMNWASHRGFVVCVRVCAQRPASMCAEPYKVDAKFRPRCGWGLAGSTNSYTTSYTIRATENANTFPAGTFSEPGALATGSKAQLK